MKLYFGTPGWGWIMWGIGYKARWFIGFTARRNACPHGDCLDKAQCWEPCGELGKSEEHAVAMRCDDCRSVGALHCAHPDECGGMKPVPNA